jgi:hypothetical protein
MTRSYYRGLSVIVAATSRSNEGPATGDMSHVARKGNATTVQIPVERVDIQ